MKTQCTETSGNLSNSSYFRYMGNIDKMLQSVQVGYVTRSSKLGHVFTNAIFIMSIAIELHTVRYDRYKLTASHSIFCMLKSCGTFIRDHYRK